MRALWIGSLICLLSTPAYAQAWKFVPSRNSSTIDAGQDTIVVTLRDSRVTADGNWLKKVSDAGLVVQASVSTSESDRPLIFPFAFETRVRARDKTCETADLPFGQVLVPRLKLTQGTTKYDALHLEVTLLKTDKPTKLAKVLQLLLTESKGATLPASPLGTALGYLVRFASSAVDDALKEVKEKIPLGRAPFAFGTDSETLKTGRWLLMERPCKDAKDEETGGYLAGFVNPKSSDYCLRLSSSEADAFVEVGKRANENDTTCTSSPFTSLKNSYVAFVLQKKVPESGSIKADEVKRILAECRENWIPESDCVAAKQQE